MKDWAVSSAGEHHVDIVGVTGSIPVPPTINTKDLYGIFFNTKFLFLNNRFFSIIVSFFIPKIYSPYSKKSNREKE